MIPIIVFGSTSLIEREFEENRELTEASRRFDDTRHALLHLLTLHLDLETADRGFAITRDRAFLQPRDSAERQIDAVMGWLRGAVRDAPEFARLEQESAAKRRFVGDTIALVESGRSDEARQAIASGRGREIMDRIRDLIQRIDAAENAQLEQIVAETETDRRQLSRAIILLQTILLFLILVAALVGFRINASRKRALERSENSHARQAAILDSATDAMLLLDAQGRIRGLNAAALTMYRYREEQLIGQSVASLYAETPPPERVERFLRAVDANRGGARLAQDFLGQRSDGSILATEVTVGVVSGQAERTYIAVIRDVTERKQMERMKSEFVSIVSHELRTPLTSIAGSLGLLTGGAAGPLPERAAKLVNIAHANCARLVRLINDILDIEKIEAGQMAFDIRPLPLAPLIEQCIQANAAFAAEHGVTIRADSVPPGLRVMADEDRLVQVVTNLLSNASKFSPRGEAVRITVAPGADMHRISVADRGPGIPADFRDRIFQKFAQADASDTRQKGGTGLGLSIVAEIVDRLKGRVSYDSVPGQGATFHVDLPAAPEGDQA